MNDSAPASLRSRKTAIVSPAFNEAESIGPLLDEVSACMPGVKTIVVSDGSLDATAEIAAARSADVLDLPCNLGVGGAVQAGMRHAWNGGHRLVIRLDGDGQHPPSEIPKLLAKMDETNADLVVGSRFLGAAGSCGGTTMRKIGNVLLARFLSAICRARVTDPTSGFWCVRDDLLRYFSLCYPCEYPEPEALALLRRQGYAMAEAAVSVRPRQHGVSTIGSIDTIYFAMRVSLALVADRVRPVDRRFANPRGRKES